LCQWRCIELTNPKPALRFLARLVVFGLVWLLSGCVPSSTQPPSSEDWSVLCTDQLPESECAALFELLGQEIPAPCDKVTHISCDGGHITRVDFRWAHTYGYHITEIPASIRDLTYLTELRLFGNLFLIGTLPPELSTLENLEILDIGDVHLRGQVPPELAALSELRYLNLDDDELEGAIPPELGQFRKHEYLHLFGNQLTGSIPPELGNLTELQELHLGHNQLSGPIPAELGKLSQLRLLYLHDNQLSGSIPAELGDLSQLEDLYLRQNQLTGIIPPEVAQLDHLARLDVSFNPIQGELPDDLSDTVQVFWFHQTQLSESEASAWREEIPYASAVVRYEDFDCASVTTLPREECEALLAVYLPLDENVEYYSGMTIYYPPFGIDYGAPFDWLLVRDYWSNEYPVFVHDDPCLWFTVSCGEGHVRYLTIGYESLPESYRLPPEIVNLAYVESLNIHPDATYRGDDPICYDADSGIAEWLQQRTLYDKDMIQPCAE
jgi:hypothetical protein